MSEDLQLTVATDAGNGAPGEVKRWLMELKLADKREKDWRKDGREVYERYRGSRAKRNSFNVLWANTEIMAPAIFSSAPKVDVRRRWRDEDVLGKAMAEVLERATEYSVDAYDFEHQIRQAVLDMLLPGRGVVRVRYVPAFVPTTAATPTPPGLPEPEASSAPDEAMESPQESPEELAWEQATCEWVPWERYRQGPGKSWDEKPWIAFLHLMTREELVEKFGDLGKQVSLDQSPADEDVQKLEEREREVFKRAQVWEIWDRDSRQVLFINESVTTEPLMTVDDPLRLLQFFPAPRPLMAIDDPDKDVPIPLYRQYREQADELDRISTRINKLIDALKLRGIYDSTLSEMDQVMRGNDNQLIPAQNVRALIERGGLEKAIWFLPIQQSAQVLQELYKQREQCKSVIYELTGLADIMRGSSSASETATAQRIKEQFGSMRLKRMQRECARFIRDLVRLKAEIIAEHFSVETIKQQTGLKYPTEQEKQQAQMMAMQAQQAGQPAPEDIQRMLARPSWEQIMQSLKDDSQRLYKVDIETDSTVAETLARDQKDISDLLAGITQFIAGVGPAVESGAMPMEAAKQLLMSAIRHARMGRDVEDALEMLKQPEPGPNADMEAAKAKAQGEQMKMQNELALEKERMQGELAIRREEIQGRLAIEREKMMANIELERARGAYPLQA